MAEARGAAPAAGEEEAKCAKPFAPEKAKEIIMSSQQPVVFCNMVFDWPARHWTANHLAEVLHGRQVRFRMGVKSTDTVPQFETTCSYVEATLEEFLTWNSGQSTIYGPFRDYDHLKFWAYADYKYCVSLFEDKTDILQDVIWSDFGFPGRNGRESTLWIGSLGAHTPCHLDSYGCNLVFQDHTQRCSGLSSGISPGGTQETICVAVPGVYPALASVRKRWHLFPPEDTPFLYPTRIPYEESSVFSKINVVNPDLKHFPHFQKARRHTVTLHPGQVLLVPRHWWHYVESIDPVTVSINSWIELEEDHQARVEEAITRMLVCALKTAENPHNTRAWLNPTENEETSHEVNCRYLNGAVFAFLNHCTSKIKDIQILRPNGECVEKEDLHMEVERTGSQSLAFGAVEQETAFAPDLIPVLWSSEDPPTSQRSTCESDGKDSVNQDGEHGGKMPCSKRQQMRTQSVNAILGQPAVNSAAAPSQASVSTDEQPVANSPAAPSQICVSTDDLLDCLVHPQVTRIVAQLLIQGKSL